MRSFVDLVVVCSLVGGVNGFVEMLIFFMSSCS